MVLVPSGRILGIFEDADETEGPIGNDRVALQLADVTLAEGRCVVAVTPSSTVPPADIDHALAALRCGGERVIVLMPWGDARSMRVRLVDAGRSATPVEDAACAVALVLAGWSWDGRDVIPVDVDGQVIAVRVTNEGTAWWCAVG